MAGKTREDLEDDLMLERAVSMTLGLIGEKANKISPAFRNAHPDIEWRLIIGQRNRIVHSYEDLDFDIIYNTVKVSILELRQQLLKVSQEQEQKLEKDITVEEDLKKDRGHKL